MTDRNLNEVKEFDPNALDGLQEYVNNSWYKYSVGKNKGLHPSIGETNLNYTGPTQQYEWLDPKEPYSWVKTPRYKNMPMEVGPLARCIVNYADKNEMTIDAVDRAISTLGQYADKFNGKPMGITFDAM